MKRLRLLYLVVLLLMVAVGAKADGLNITSNHIGKVLCTDGTIYATTSAADNAGKLAVAMIAYVDEQNHKGLAIALTDAGDWTWSEANHVLQEWASYGYGVPNATWKVPNLLEWQQMLIGCGTVASVTDNNLESVSLSTVGINQKLRKAAWESSALSGKYWTAAEYDNDASWYADFSSYISMTLNHGEKTIEYTFRLCLAFDINTDIPSHPIKVGDAENGTIQADATSVAAGETVTLTATPAPGYMLEEIVVTDQDNNPIEVIGGMWYSYGNDNKATFDMPESNVTIVATFTNAKTAADGLAIKMPTWGEVYYTIPDNVYSFKVVSDGLNGGFHSSECSGYLSLTTSANHIFQLNCNYKQSAKSGFSVYDGAIYYSSPVIVQWVQGSGGVDTSHNIAIPESGLVESTTPNMTIYYWSDMQHDAQAWFDMTVNVAATYIASSSAPITTESEVTLPSLNVDLGLSAPGSSAGDANIDGEKANIYTLCLPYAPTASEGMKFYTLDRSTESSLKFKEISGNPAANTPYLVAVFTNKNVGQNINTSVTLEKEIDKGNATEGFKFLGTTTGMANDEAAAKNAYILQDGNTWGRVPAGHPEVYIPPFRAYIVPTAATGRSVLMSSFGDATGITTMQLTDRDGITHYFDLNGRRISSPTTQGVYVTNGKKVIIK